LFGVKFSINPQKIQVIKVDKFAENDFLRGHHNYFKEFIQRGNQKGKLIEEGNTREKIYKIIKKP